MQLIVCSNRFQVHLSAGSCANVVEVDPPISRAEAPAGSCCARKAGWAIFTMKLQFWVWQTLRKHVFFHCRNFPLNLAVLVLQFRLAWREFVSFRQEQGQGPPTSMELQAITVWVNTSQDGIHIQHDGCVVHCWQIWSRDNCSYMNVLPCFWKPSHIEQIKKDVVANRRHGWQQWFKMLTYAHFFTHLQHKQLIRFPGHPRMELVCHAWFLFWINFTT